MRIFAVLFILVWTTISSKGSKPVFTQVTYLYDIHRQQLPTGYGRTFQSYLDNFDKLLKTDTNLIIFAGSNLKSFIWERRKEENTIFIEREIEEYQKRWYADPVQKLRQKFLVQAKSEWQKTLPTYALKNYALIMMAKLYLCEEALKLDKWNTDFMIWTDAGYAHIYKNKNVYQPENIVMNYYKYIQPQWSAFTYEYPDTIFFGYELREVRYINREVAHQEKILAGNMGGYVTIVKDIKNAFQNLLRITLAYGDFYSDEPIITLLPIRFPFIFPTTLVLNLQKFGDTFYVNEQINRITEHQRYFNIDFSKFINDTNFVQQQHITPIDSQSNVQQKDSTLNCLKKQFIIRKSFVQNAIDKKLIYFGLFAAFYIFFLNQNHNVQKKIQKLRNQSIKRRKEIILTQRNLASQM